MIEPQEFRDLMAGVCAPVTVVTTTGDGRPYGATVSSFTSLSLNPPLVSVAFDRGSALLGQIREAGRFGVNILGHAQDDLAMTFARRGADQRRAGPGHVVRRRARGDVRQSHAAVRDGPDGDQCRHRGEYDVYRRRP